MGFGLSKSYNTSIQEAQADITQDYSGTCQISCNNEINNVDIDIVNSNVQGGINMSQTCTTNGTCLFNNTMNATSDVLFKASNSSNASDAGGWFAGVYNEDISSNKSYQSINQSINQLINQNCNVSSTNQINNVDIFAENSTIGGGINIGQNGVTNGNCQLTASMTASEYASGTIDNCSAAGKKSKKMCGKGKGKKSPLNFIITGVVLLFLFIIMVVVYRKFFANKTPAK